MTHTPTAPLSDLPRIIRENLLMCRETGNANATLVLSREMLEELDGLIGRDVGVSQDETLTYDEWARHHGLYELPQFRNLHGDFRECWHQARKDMRAELQKAQEELRSLITQRDLLSANAVSAEMKLDELAATYRHQFIEEAVQWLSEQTSLFTHNDFREEMTIRTPPQHNLPQPMEWQSAVGDGRMNKDWQLYVDGSLRRYIENRLAILERRIAELEKRG